MNPEIYEKSGVFYLGRTLSNEDFAPTDEAFLYDARDLTTHAVCVGMTGSGKTGLGIAVLEEAAMDRIPAIVIDPKGDMGNLLLTFPGLDPASFLPWISEEEANRKNVTREALAQSTAESWAKGLGNWGQSGERIARLRDTVDIALFTPGSTTGRPLALLRSFSAPPAELREDLDAWREQISTTVSGLLTLAGMDADPIQSREHIVLSHIVNAAWERGEDLDLVSLVGRIPNPGIARIGAFDLESFFPSKDRMAFAMRLNALLASPSFAAWTEGEPLDIDALLQAPNGKPRVSILNIAHLSDQERMFLVTQVISALTAWMRRQPGTSSLRALFYMDEIFGFLPPVAEPPSKKGLLTLLKQARAFGLGLMLCTQNPADIDYKALSNAGTWFIGRLQTERDRDRLLEGLTSSMDAGSAAMDRSDVARLISGLGSRRFLVQNIHTGYPQLFETRWVMSYLAGPLSRVQVRELVRTPQAAAPTFGRVESAPAARQAPTSPPVIAPSNAGLASTVATPVPTASVSNGGVPAHLANRFGASRPPLPAGIREAFVMVREPALPGEKLLWRPMIFGCGSAVVERKRPVVNASIPLSRISFVEDSPVPLNWQAANECPFDERSLESSPTSPGIWEYPAQAMLDSKQYKAWERDLVTWFSLNCGVEVYEAPKLKMTSAPGERAEVFRSRVELAAREQRDAEKDALVATWRERFAKADAKIADLESKARARQAEARSKEVGMWLDVGSALFGGKKSAARSAVNRQAQAAKQSEMSQRAWEQYEEACAARERLSSELSERLARIENEFSDAARTIEVTQVTPAKSSIQLRYFGFVWVPYYESEQGQRRRAWVPTPLSV